MLSASVKVATRSLRAHRMRSVLTMLGIVIGVAALVMMVGVGSGARDRQQAGIDRSECGVSEYRPQRLNV